jgi:hypothetical protein
VPSGEIISLALGEILAKHPGEKLIEGGAERAGCTGSADSARRSSTP